MVIAAALAAPLCAGPDPARLVAPPFDGQGCVDPAAAAARFGAEGAFDASITTEHFQIDYDPSSQIVSEDYLALLAESLETAWDVEVEELGWPPPEGSDDQRVQVILADFPSDLGWGGVASTAECDGRDVGYIVLNTDWWYWSLDALRDIPAHELAHLLQYASGTVWDGDDEVWFYEATAVWIQDHVFEDTNTYADDFLPAYLASPEVTLTAFEYGTGLQYGHFVWPLHLDEHHGGPDVVREIWTAPEGGLFETFEARLGADRAALWAGYLAHMASFDVSDHDVFVDAWERSGEPWYSAEEEVPAAFDGTVEPEELGAAWLHLVAPEGSGIRFTLQGDAEDGWVAGGSDGADFVTALADDGGLTLSFSGSEAWIGVGPTERDGGSWSWEAETVAAEEPAGCGCGAGATPALGAAVAAGLLARRSRGGKGLTPR